MNDRSILATQFSSIYNLNPMVKDTYGWLLENKHLDTTQDKYVALVSSISSLVKTPISECFNNIKSEKLIDSVYYVSTIMNKHVSVPELLTISDLSIYGKALPYCKSADLKRSWLNISSMLSPPSKNRYSDLNIAASNDIMSSVVRACLCMSYYDTKEWLNPKLATFVIELYTTMMRTVLDRYYRLDMEDGAIVKYAFAYYYAYLLNNAVDKNGAPMLLQKSNLLFKAMSASMDDMAVMMSEILNGEEITIDHVVTFIKTHGPDRMNTLTKDLIYRSMNISSNKSVATWIAVDYPPYLVYLLFLSMSGNKHPIISNIINNILDIKYVRQNVEQLLKYPNLYNGVKWNVNHTN